MNTKGQLSPNPCKVKLNNSTLLDKIPNGMLALSSRKGTNVTMIKASIFNNIVFPWPLPFLLNQIRFFALKFFLFFGNL